MAIITCLQNIQKEPERILQRMPECEEEDELRALIARENKFSTYLAGRTIIEKALSESILERYKPTKDVEFDDKVLSNKFQDKGSIEDAMFFKQVRQKITDPIDKVIFEFRIAPDKRTSLREVGKMVGMSYEGVRGREKRLARMLMSRFIEQEGNDVVYQ